MSAHPVQSAADDLSAYIGTDQEGAAPVRDRLTTTLFLTALFHGIVIIGVTFTATPWLDENPTPALEVLLLSNDGPNEADNPDAPYLAQRNQAGRGTTTDRIRPAGPAPSPLPAFAEGTPQGDGTEMKKAVAGTSRNEVLASRAERAEQSYQSGVDAPAQRSETPLALNPTPPSPVATSLTEDRARFYGKDVRVLEITPDTRESRLAPYLSAWKQKIERIGTLNYPMEARRKSMSGNPVMEVAIRADGSVADMMVRRSSGHKEIDQAALAILRMAAPFDPFPPALRKDYDLLRFAYEWQFTGDKAGGTLTTQDR